MRGIEWRVKVCEIEKREKQIYIYIYIYICIYQGFIQDFSTWRGPASLSSQILYLITTLEKRLWLQLQSL